MVRGGRTPNSPPGRAWGRPLNHCRRRPALELSPGTVAWSSVGSHVGEIRRWPTVSWWIPARAELTWGRNSSIAGSESRYGLNCPRGQCSPTLRPRCGAVNCPRRQCPANPHYGWSGPATTHPGPWIGWVLQEGGITVPGTVGPCRGHEDLCGGNLWARAGETRGASH
jgi:hypothetical protein